MYGFKNLNNRNKYQITYMLLYFRFRKLKMMRIQSNLFKLEPHEPMNHEPAGVQRDEAKTYFGFVSMQNLGNSLSGETYVSAFLNETILFKQHQNPPPLGLTLDRDEISIFSLCTKVWILIFEKTKSKQQQPAIKHFTKQIHD